MKTLILALFLLVAPLQAQTPTQRAADITSTGLVGVNIAADAVHSYRNHCLKNFAYRNLLAIGVSELGKVIVREDRPDHSDFRSFPSEHSALAMANSGWNFKIGFSIALGAGAGRVIAAKHHPTDVLVGLGAGLGAAYLFPCGEFQP